MGNASNISQEEVIYEFDHQDGENVDFPMLGVPQFHGYQLKEAFWIWKKMMEDIYV